MSLVQRFHCRYHIIYIPLIQSKLVFICRQSSLHWCHIFKNYKPTPTDTVAQNIDRGGFNVFGPSQITRAINVTFIIYARDVMQHAQEYNFLAYATCQARLRHRSSDIKKQLWIALHHRLLTQHCCVSHATSNMYGYDGSTKHVPRNRFRATLLHDQLCVIQRCCIANHVRSRNPETYKGVA